MNTLLAFIAVIHLAMPAHSAAAADNGSDSCRDRIENFAHVTSHLFRAAQFPPVCAGYIATVGIRTVVDLRRESALTAIEREKAVAAGMRYIHMPMSPFSRPSRAQVDEVLRIIREPRNQPVLVHCKRGRDRTGAIIAAYRIADEGWSTEAALKEAKRFGLGWWQIHMKRFIKSLAPAHLSPLSSLPPAA